MKPNELQQITDSFIESKFSDEISKIEADMRLSAEMGEYWVALNQDFFKTTHDVLLICNYLTHKGFKTNITNENTYIVWG